MKRLCFLEFEGLLDNELDYCVDEKKAEQFVINIRAFCLKNNIELFLVSGFHEKVALKKFQNSFVKKYFKKENFFFVNDNYIYSKKESDRQIHENNLEKDAFFVDSFFKQTLILNILNKKNVLQNDAVLFCNDVWVDGYYTVRFSKINFVIFEKNVRERGKVFEPISGLAYFDFDSNPKNFLEKFPIVDYSFLEKYVFDSIKEVLLKDVDFNKIKEKIGGKIVQ